MTDVSIARRQTLGLLLARTARRYPDKPAVICGETTWTYREFDEISDRVAGALVERGLKKGERIAILARNSHAFVALRFAAARMGAIIVPINFMLKPDEIAFILRHSGARFFCTDTSMLEAATAAAAGDGVAVDTLIWLPGEAHSEPAAGMITFDELAAWSGDFSEDESLQGSDTLQILYTSGTESAPKGAMLTHDAIIAEYVSCIASGGFEAADVVLHALPLFHTAQLDAFFGPCVYLGSTNVIIGAPAPDVVVAKVEEHGVTSFFAPPTIWISLLRSPAFDAGRLATLKKGFYGASIMPVPVLKEIQQRLDGFLLWNFYGQTEIAPVASMLMPEDQIRKAGSAGKAALNVELRLVDDDGNDVPTGEIGEIVSRSPQLMSGYYNDPEKTAAAFAGGWFHSGDLGIMDEDGYITVVDRKKDMIKTGGENVASREVEETIYTLDGISEVAVIGLSDPYWVEAVTAIIVRKPDAIIDEAAVLAHCKERMAGYKVPKRVIFADNLPRNPSGKILKRNLRQAYEKQAAE
ncbi:acyl-CoA synthetase [Limoniibacter endophyticus]|uniref:3-methylmercaptopropionyl-CoA ligase n=1 Tax=Limoniibacter endophyticus TaxID=1565040 RepID=A0A8J3DSS2_9HYPH|nr:acyl-CoA synthetase [Limoniibacter endophyticus]GHC78797.1 acyl-CoA synthetase [Limoniibacter endophyticus]